MDEPGNQVENREKNGQFAKGHSGNLNGRGKGTVNLMSAVKRLLREPCPRDKERRRYADLMAESLCINFIKGNGTVIKELLGRLEGPLAEVLEGTGAKGEVILRVLYGDSKRG